MAGDTTAPLVADQLSPQELATFGPDASYLVEVVRGPDAGTSVTLAPGESVVVGTASDASLRLSDETVSRRHLRLTRTAEGLSLEDLGSSNGTVLGGARVQQVVVRREAFFTTGASVLRAAAVPPGGGEPTRFGALVGSGARMQALFAQLQRAAGSISTVLLTGETGTGKELAARELHAQSPRRHRPFVVVDCGALGGELVSSTLFGHVRGAFTGAGADRVGAIEAASGGTVFLDEVGDLPLELQPTLLRVLEGRTVRRVGDTVDRAVDVRVLAATHRDLEAEVAAGRFREDLYYRLNVIRVEVPPLRERLDDLPRLVAAFLAGPRAVPGFALSPQVLEAMQTYRWPGNVRELRNLVERAVAGGEISSVLAGRGPTSAEAVLQAGVDLPFKQAKEALVEAFARDYFTRLLERSGGKVAEMAKAAGIARTYAHDVVKKLGLKTSDEPKR
ncbi:MAG: sigma 54-interacting transcriptional regulator [Myxococcaceae bacterium]|nr:sigma 54-interacting transcriptional regulator [Myxococcaceae bacterium]